MKNLFLNIQCFLINAFKILLLHYVHSCGKADLVKSYCIIMVDRKYKEEWAFKSAYIHSIEWYSVI
jgi:hypothetical protein